MQQLWNLNNATTLVFIRHAQAADRDRHGNLRLCGWLDVPLTSNGRLEAECLPDAVARLGRIAALYTSSLRRAMATALPIAHRLGIEPRALHSLREISCGDLDGVPVAEVKRKHGHLWQANLAQDNDGFRWPGGESYRTFRARVMRTVDALRQSHAGGTILVVTHAGVVSQVLGSLAGVSAAGWERFRPANASVTEVRWAGDRGVVVRFDDRRHLARLRSPDDVRATNDPQMLTYSRDGCDPLTGRPAGHIHRDG